MRKIIFLLSVVLTIVFLFPQCQDHREKKAKYIFYFIGDGMGVNQVVGTQMFLAESSGKIGVGQLSFTQFPVINYATTYSRYNSVTCSAAAGTALATGVKTKNGTIGMDSLQKNPVYSIAVSAKNAGKKVGITTSVTVDHATPAAFYAHQPSRSKYYKIAMALPETGFDLYAGSGFQAAFEHSKKDSLKRDIFSVFRDSGYIVLRGVDEFKQQSSATEKVILLPEKSEEAYSLPYAIDRKQEDMTLAQITENAINFLSADSDKGFFLMVEGGKIDWACHSNDVATVFREVEDFSEAIQKALDFYHQHPDETLIVVTADHETGGLALGSGQYKLNTKVLQYQKASKDILTRKIQKLRKKQNNKVSWEEVQALLSENLGFWNEVELTEAQEGELKEVYQKTFTGGEVKLEKYLYEAHEPLAGKAVNLLNEIAMIRWSSGGHSAGAVPVYAIGAGARLFTGALDNTDIPKRIAEASGLPF